MIGQTISHYRILSKLGEGGMGVVYKAEDIKLKRTVALKFLPPDLTRDKAAKTRFIHEAQAASALQHHNICTIHEIDETKDGRLFICMDCYDGETLKEKIARGPLPMDKAVDIASQVAAGLSKAHEAGMVHRDIKPANIMVTKDGVVKLLDFGLAKLAGQTKVTRTGTTVGTVAYMSPEQATGRELDVRSDTWSLGVVLYEMLVGRPPFTGEHEVAVLYQIVNEEPEPATALRTGLPVEIERVMDKSMAKKPEERYQHADELLVDLKRLAKVSTTGARVSRSSPLSQRAPRKLTFLVPVVLILVAAIVVGVYFLIPRRDATKHLAIPATAPQASGIVWRNSVAVLPFKDFSPQKDQEYFCDGITDDIITKLSSIRDLKVISRTSAMQFKDTKKNVREIGRELGVRAILEGSIQKEKDRIRINAQLIGTADDAHLWADKYDRELTSIFDVQDEISRAIVDALDVTLTSAQLRGMTKRPIDNAAAYECYLKAWYEIRKFDEGAVDRALHDLENGIEIIGHNALLYSGVAYAYYQYVNMGTRQEESIAQAEEYAHKALAVDPDCPQAYVVLGRIYSDCRGNQQEAVRQYKKALDAKANEPRALGSLASVYVMVGKLEAARSLMERVEELDPLNPPPWGDLYYAAGDYQLAVDSYDRFYRDNPKFPGARFVFAWGLVLANKLAEARAFVDSTTWDASDNVSTRFGRLLKYAVLKDKERAFEIMTPDFQKTCKRDPSWSFNVAMCLSLLGAKEEALDWLENAVNRGFICYPIFLSASARDPFFVGIRNEERLKKLVERVKYEWEHFEVPK